MTEPSIRARFEALGNAQKPQPQTPPAPRTLHVVGSNPAYVDAVVRREIEAVAAAVEGTRNDTLNRAAFNVGTLVAGGEIAASEAASAIQSAAVGAGLSESEARATIASAFRAAAQSPRTAPPPTVRDDDLSWVNKATGEIAAPAPVKADIEAFWSARDDLGIIRQAARARMASPWAVLGVVLARVITVTPPDVVLPPLVGGHGSLNLFIGLVENSGGGKGAATAAARDAIDIEFTDGREHEVNVGSGEGIIHAFVRPERGGGQSTHHVAALVSIAEIDTLTATSKRQGATIMPILRSGWSGERLGFQNADASRRLHVEGHTYRLTLVAGIQPGRADALLGDSDGGTPQRFIWLPAGDAEAPDAPPPMPAPLAWKGIGQRVADAFSGLTTMRLAPVIGDTVRAERLARLRGHAPDHLGGHDTFCRVKLAAAFALLDGRLEVTDADWDLSGVMHGVSIATREATAEGLRRSKADRNRSAGVADAERAEAAAEVAEAKALKRVSRWVVARLSAGPATGGALRRSAASRDRPHLEAALTALVATGQINAENANDGSSITYSLGVRNV